MRHTAAPLVHKDIHSILEYYANKKYPTRVDEDIMLGLKRYLSNQERHLRKLVDRRNSKSCYHLIVKQTSVIAQKRASLDYFKEKTGVDQEYIRILESTWDIPYQELTIVHVEPDQITIHQQILIQLDNLKAYNACVDKETVTAIGRCALQANAHGYTQQASHLSSCLEYAPEFFSGSTTAFKEQAVKRATELLIGMPSVLLAGKLLTKLGVRCVLPLQLGMALYGLYQDAHILRQDIDGICSALAKGDMSELGNACTHTALDVLDATLSFRSLYSTLKTAYTQGILRPVAQVIDQGVKQAQAAQNTSFCPDHTSYQRYKNCHALQPQEIAHCVMDIQRVSSLEQYFKKLTNKVETYNNMK